jgi:cytochrome c-type biogenesis protein CcmF
LLCLFIVIGIATLFIKLRAIPTQKTNQVLNSKEFLINIGSIILLCIAFIVFLGTSWPIIAEITGKQKASVEASWYNLLNLPLAVIMLLTNAYSIYARWGKSENSALIKQTINYIGISILLTLVTYFFGVKDFKFIVLAFSTYLALITNSEFIISSIRNNPKATGAYLSHFGIALLILGAMATGGYSEKKQIRLEEGKSSKFLDYSIKFSSKEQIDKQWQDREKYKYTFEIDKNGSKGTVHPIVYWSDFNERKAPFFEPGIKAGFMQDLYISPYSIEYTYDYPPSILQKENKAKISVDSNYQIQLLKFEMSGARNGGEDGALKVGAVVRFSGLNNFIKEDTVYAFLDPKSGLNVPIWKQVGNSEIEVGFIQLIPDKQDLSKSKAVFAYKQKGKDLLPPKEIFVFEASTKPFIALVWIGTIFLVVGFIYSIFKYRQDFVTLAKDNSPSNDNQLVDAENSSSNVDIQENEK